MKVRERNLFGDEEDLLYVKGSGWDLATIEAAGFAPVRMKTLLQMAELDYLEPSRLDRRPKVKDAPSLDREIADLEKEMQVAAKELEFEKAAQLRDRIRELRQMKLF